MSLAKEQKSVEISFIVERLEENPAVYLTDFMGLDVVAMGALRDRFRKSGVEYRVVKNTLLRRAMEQIGGYEPLMDTLHGPTAIALSTEPSAAARVINEFKKSQNSTLPELKAAYIDGAFFTSDQLDVLASLKSREELLGEVVTLLLSPASNVMSAIGAPGSALAGILEVLQEKESSLIP